MMQSVALVKSQWFVYQGREFPGIYSLKQPLWHHCLLWCHNDITSNTEVSCHESYSRKIGHPVAIISAKCLLLVLSKNHYWVQIWNFSWGQSMSQIFTNFSPFSSLFGQTNCNLSSLLSTIENLYAQGFSTNLCMFLLSRLLGMDKGCCIVLAHRLLV